MMAEFKRRIANAMNFKTLKKIEQEARNQYGIWAKEYAEILELCWNKLEELE